MRDAPDGEGGFQSTGEMTIEELREEAQELQNELDFFDLAETQQPEWDRHDEVARALRERSDVEFPECPVASCESTRWRFAAGEPPVCGNGHEVADSELEQEIHGASERLIHGPSDEQDAELSAERDTESASSTDNDGPLMKKYECGHISISRDGTHSHECSGCRPGTSLDEGEKDELFEELREGETYLRLASEGIVWFIDRVSVDDYQFVNPDNHATDSGDMDKVREAMDVYDEVSLVEEDDLPEVVADVF